VKGKKCISIFDHVNSSSSSSSSSSDDDETNRDDREYFRCFCYSCSDPMDDWMERKAKIRTKFEVEVPVSV